MEASRLAERWANEVAESRKFIGPELEFLRGVLADHRSMGEALKRGALPEFLVHLALIESFQGESTLVWWRALGEVTKDGWLKYGTRKPVRAEAVAAGAEKFNESIRDEFDYGSPGSRLAELQSEGQKLEGRDLAKDLRRYMSHEESAPESVRKAIAPMDAWLRGEIMRLHAAAALSFVAADREKSAGERADAEKALAAAMAELPKNQQRVAEARRLHKDAVDALARNANEQRRWELTRKVDSEKEALGIAERIQRESELEIEGAESNLAEAKKQEADYSAEEKAIQGRLDVHAKDAKDANALVLVAWAQLVAEVETKVAAVEESSKRLDADEAHFRRAAERWLEEAKNLARTKGG